MKNFLWLLNSAKAIYNGFLKSGPALGVENQVRAAISAKSVNRVFYAQAIMTGAGLLIPGGSAASKMHSVSDGLMNALMVSGIDGFGKQALTQAFINVAPKLGSALTAINHGYRGLVESRTSARIPFSHSTIAMDQAFANIQYAQQRLGSAYSLSGSEATFFAAKYMSRG